MLITDPPMIIMGPQNSGEQSGFVRESTIFYFLIGVPCTEREAVQNINSPGRGRGRGRGKGGRRERRERRETKHQQDWTRPMKTRAINICLRCDPMFLLSPKK